MKKSVLIALLAVCIALAAIPLNEGPFPRYATGRVNAFTSWDGLHRSYADVITEAPILVEVEITKHRGDLPMKTYFYGTLYEAKVLTCYKNETSKKLDMIELVQDGNSEMTYEGYTLFQTGDRLLLPLLSCEKNSILSDTHPNWYQIYGTSQTAMQIVETVEGDVCYTFLPIIEDLPDTTISSEMWKSIRNVMDRKYISSDETFLPENPGTVVVVRNILDEWIEKVLSS